MTTRAIRTQHGIAAFFALPHTAKASLEDRMGAAMEVAFEEGKREAFEEAAELADLRVAEWSKECYATECELVAFVCKNLARDIRALSSAPPRATAQHGREKIIAGLEEAIAVARGEKQPARSTTYSVPATAQPRSEEGGGASEADVKRLFEEIVVIEKRQCGDDGYGNYSREGYALKGFADFCKKISALTAPSPKPEDALREALSRARSYVELVRAEREVSYTGDGPIVQPNKHDEPTRTLLAQIDAALAKEGK